MESPGHWNKPLNINLTSNFGPRDPIRPPGFQPVRPLVSSNTFPRPVINLSIERKPELWVETETVDGKKYYYHAKTRVSSWILPANVKLMSQQELESLAGHTPHTNDSKKALENVHLPLNDNKLSSNSVIPSNILSLSLKNLSGDLLSVDSAINNSETIKVGTEDVPLVSNYGSNSKIQVPQKRAESFDDKSSGEMRPNIEFDAYANSSINKLESSSWHPVETCHWSEHHNEHGRLYYYNNQTMQSTWIKPIAYIKWEDEQKNGLIQEVKKIETQINENNELIEMAKDIFESGLEKIQVAVNLNKEDHTNAKNDVLDKTEENDKDKLPLPEVICIKDKESQKSNDSSLGKKNVKISIDPSKPINTKPVPGTPWCMVWTGEGRIFFFNPSTNTSVWDRPLELAKRTDVDKMMELTPDILNERKDEPAIKKAKMETILHQQSNPNSYVPNNFLRPQLRGQQSSVRDQRPNFRQHRPQVSSSKSFWDKDKQVDAATETKAAQERAILSLIDRTTIFEQMLEEKQVSCFSSWDRELPKFVFDSRYLILAPKDRRPAFDNFLRKKVEEERKERSNKIKQNKEEFRKLLQSARLHGKSMFSEFSSKFCRDSRFKCIEKVKERESIFNEYIIEVKKQEQEESNSNLLQIRDDFMHLLEGCPGIGPTMQWIDARNILMYSSHARFIIDMPVQTEKWFDEYCKGYIDASEYDMDEEAKLEKERQERMQYSMKEREKEVAETLQVSFLERDKERKVHMREDAIINFKAILTDMVKDADAKWRDKRKMLKKDDRYMLTKHIDKKEKEHLFNQHVISLEKKSKDLFYKILYDAVADNLTISWQDVRKIIRDDPRCAKITVHDKKRERDFEEYIIQRRVKAKQEFKELLLETRLIKHRISLFETDSIKYMKEIVTALQKDKRYDMLNSIADERHQLLLNYIEDVSIQKEPPPTSSEPRKLYSK